MKRKFFTLIISITLGITYGINANAITFNTFVSDADLNVAVGQNNTISFAYAGNKFVGSVYTGANNNQLYQTDLNGKNVKPFGAPIPNASNEIYLSTSLGLGGFTYRDIFAAQGNGVYRISNNGSVGNTFASGLNGIVREIAFDPYGFYGYDMVVSTDVGNIYRINSFGNSTLIANVGADTEGLDFAPQRFGNYPKGTLITASEGNGRLNAVLPNGTVSDLGVYIDGAVEKLFFVPATVDKLGNPTTGFYVARYPTDIQRAPANEFVPYIGDAIATTESGHQLVRIHWNGKLFETSVIGSVEGQIEGSVFVPSVTAVGGSSTGVANKQVVCKNINTGQTVIIPLNGANSWDCQMSGLIVKAKDNVSQTVTGPVK